MTYAGGVVSRTKFPEPVTAGLMKSIIQGKHFVELIIDLLHLGTAQKSKATIRFVVLAML